MSARSALTLAFVTLLSSTALAKPVAGTGWDDAARFQLRTRAIGIVPDESSRVSAGGDVQIGNAVVPEFDVTYFFTDHLAAELIAATAKHSVSHSALGQLGDA